MSHTELTMGDLKVGWSLGRSGRPIREREKKREKREEKREKTKEGRQTEGLIQTIYSAWTKNFSCCCLNAIEYLLQ